MPDVSVSVVSLLDTSGSMASAMPMVIIDGKAFVRSARPNDQIAVVQFQTTASMVYPSTATFATVDPPRTVTAAAAAAIQNLTSGDLTNMAQAISIANTILGSATWPTRAYMLLSDGDWNTGGDPSGAMPNNVPLFVCGLGPGMRQSYVQGMLDKNPKSRYLASPNAVQMMQVFNAIRGLAAQAEVAVNVVAPYAGTDYTVTPVTVSAATDETQFTVVWSNAGLSYTSGIPDPTHVNIVLMDPTGTPSPAQPVIADPGYAIFEVQNPQPGQWQVLAQYASQSGSSATTAGFEYDTGVSLSLDAPAVAPTGEPVRVRAHVVDGTAPVEGAAVTLRLRSPRHDVHAALEQHAAAVEEHLDRASAPGGGDGSDRGDGGGSSLAHIDALRAVLAKQGVEDDPLEEAASFHTLMQDEDGSYVADLPAPPHGGAYTMEAVAHGHTSGAGAFQRSTMATTVVG